MGSRVADFFIGRPPLTRARGRVRLEGHEPDRFGDSPRKRAGGGHDRPGGQGDLLDEHLRRLHHRSSHHLGHLKLPSRPDGSTLSE
jgi:hypothetical protein